MTTGPETIAAAIRDGFRELAEAIASRETPRMGPRSDEQTDGVHTDPPGNHTPERPVEAAARIIRDWERDPDANWSVAAQALADAGLLATPQPMTVGQLTAEHIGKRVRVGGVIEFRLCEIEHYAAMSTSGERVLSERRTRIEDGGTQGKWTYSTDTPCEVLDD